jgi:nicotinamide mononucleotide (NMN) deamidase PncC
LTSRCYGATLLKTTALVGAGAAVGLPVSACAAPRVGAANSPAGTVRLGVASYSLRNFPLDEAIQMVRALGTPYINLNRNHLPYDLSPACQDPIF